MNEGKSQNLDVLCLQCSWLQAHAIGQEDVKDYIHLAQRPFLYFLAIGYTSGVRRGKGQDTVRRDEKKVSSKVSSQPTTNQPTIQPTKPTNQSKKQNFVAQVGSKEWHS
jgi:hypothetical protein